MPEGRCGVRASRPGTCFYVIILWMQLTIVFFSFSNTVAQQTAKYHEPEAMQHKALELFEMKNYGAAKIIFESLGNQVKRESLLMEKALFHAAVCAYFLNEDEALQRFYEFTEVYPASRWIDQSWFYIGNILFDNKKYKNALPAYNKVNPVHLTENDNAEYLFKSGYCHYRLEDYENAGQKFLSASNPGSAYQQDAVFYYALIAYQEKNYDIALGGFQNLTEHKVYGQQAIRYIIDIHYRDKSYQKVVGMASLVQTNAARKEEFRIFSLIGDACLKTGNYTKANSYLRDYVAKSGTVPTREEYYALAYSFYCLEQYKEAIPWFQKSTQKKDSLAQLAWYHLGDCYYKTGQPNFAVNAYETASINDTDKSLADEAFFIYTNLALETGQIPSRQIADRLRKYIADNQGSSRVYEAQILVFNILLSVNNYREAIEMIESAGSLPPSLRESYPQLLYLLGIEQFNLSQFTEAGKTFDKAINSSKKATPALHFWKAETDFRLDKFVPAEAGYKAVINSKPPPDQRIKAMSLYSLGHVMIKQKKFSESIEYFTIFTGLKSSVEPELLYDSYLRLGDLHFAQKKYQKAITHYEKALGMGSFKNDYALYQKAMCTGALGNYSEKTKLLDQLMSKYSASTWADDACFEAGQTSLLLNRDKEGLKYFERLINSYPNSPYSSRALVKSGLIYYNQSQYELAIESLKKAVSVFPKSQAASEAIELLKNIYLELNRVNEYTQYLKSAGMGELTDSDQAALIFEAAENQYMSRKFEAAANGFRDYIQQFTNGLQIDNAWYLLGDCYVKLDKKTEASKVFLYFLDKPAGKQAETALQTAGNIYLTQLQYDTAIMIFTRLEQIASGEKALTDALKGLVMAGYAMEEYQDVIIAAGKYLQLSGIPEEAKAEIHLYRGKSAFRLQQDASAEESLKMVISTGNTLQAAEAQYLYASLKYNSGLFSEAEKMVYELARKYPSAEEWKARGFILLSDILVKQGNYFQARHTLQSIIDNYQGKEEVELAKDKMKRVMELENQPGK